MSDFNLIPLLPEIFLSLVVMGFLIVGALQGNKSTKAISFSSVFALFIAVMLLLGIQGWDQQVTVLNNMFVFDAFAGFTKFLIAIGLAMSILLSVKYLEQEQIVRFEYPILILLSGIGMMLMVSSNNMLSLYMGLELQSLSLYVLAAFRRNSLKSSEAGIKYFILGALSSGMLLFGISLLYGYTGSLDFTVIAQTIAGLDSMPVGALVGLVFLLVGLAFKISAVPFHMWTPDVYQGSPTPVTALFAMVPKIAAIALIIRVLFGPFAAAQADWMQIIYALSLGSMIVGAFAAIGQENIKRLLAYSSIGHMGYILIGVVAGTAEGIGAVLVYMTLYLFMTAGTFSIVLSMRRNELALHKIEDLAGLSKTHPRMAYALAIFMLSMAGIPPLAGFFGKLVVFQAAVTSGFFILAVLGVLTSVVAAYYYLRIIKVMFFDEPVDEFDRDIPFIRKAIMYVSLLVSVGYIFKPNGLVEAANNVALSLF